jgi:hypothetical protein
MEKAIAAIIIIKEFRMKHLMKNILMGRSTTINGLFALAIIAAVALGCTCGKGLDFGNTSSSSNSNSSDDPYSTSTSDSQMPGDALLKALIRETTADFAYSISEEDFSKMYEKASTDFKNTYTKDQMQDFFKDFINKKRQLLPIFLKANSMEPELSPSPSIRTESGLNVLTVNGKYPTKPLPITFNYEYVNRGGSWKLLVLKVYVR